MTATWSLYSTKCLEVFFNRPNGSSLTPQEGGHQMIPEGLIQDTGFQKQDRKRVWPDWKVRYLLPPKRGYVIYITSVGQSLISRKQRSLYTWWRYTHNSPSKARVPELFNSRDMCTTFLISKAGVPELSKSIAETRAQPISTRIRTPLQFTQNTSTRGRAY